MYKNYFGFGDLPFRVTPEPHFFYSSPVYREALATLRYGIEARKGFIVITGEVGTGKTTLLKLLMRSADSVIHTAFVFNPKLDFTGLLRFILKDFGIHPLSNDKYILMEQLNDYLIQQLQMGHIVALLIDEAQQLSDGVLEELRLLSNFETEKEKLIQIVLMGQPELEQRLNRPELRQLKQRVALHCRLAPLESPEIRQYIDLRLSTVGYEGNELFEAKVIERIAFYSKGIPRLINVICDNALLIAYGTSKRKVSAEIIEEVASDLQLTVPPEMERPATNFNMPESPVDMSTDNKQAPSLGVQKRLAPLHAARDLTGLAIAFLLTFLAGGGSVLYFQPTKDYLSHVATEARDFVDMYVVASKTAKLTPHVVKEDGSKDNWTGGSQTRPEDQLAVTEARNPTAGKAADLRSEDFTHLNNVQRATPQQSPTQDLRNDIAPVPGINKPADPRMPKSSAIQVTNSTPTELTIHKPDRPRPRRSEMPRYWPHDKPAEVTPQNSPNKDQRFFRRHFEVVKNSIAFEKPTRESAIIATFRPGTWVRVEEKVGNYLHVRSLNDPWILGYVHSEDAFFEYIGFNR
jgi:general secretion pathway protein A